MTDTKRFAALLGFAFIAAWIGFNFGYAILCLVGAGAFYAVASYLEGDVDLADIQERLSRGGGEPRSATTARRRPARVR
jgi:hypothetical protein